MDSCGLPGNGFPVETAADSAENGIKDPSTDVMKENGTKCSKPSGAVNNSHIHGPNSLVQQVEETIMAQEDISATKEHPITTETDIDITAKMLPSGGTQSHFHVVRTAVSETSAQKRPNVLYPPKINVGFEAHYPGSEDSFVANQINTKIMDEQNFHQQGTIKSSNKSTKICSELLSDTEESYLQTINTSGLYSDSPTLQLGTWQHNKNNDLKCSVKDMEIEDVLNGYINTPDKCTWVKHSDLQVFNAQSYYVQNRNVKDKDITTDKLYDTSNLNKVWHVPKSVKIRSLGKECYAEDLKDVDHDLTKRFCTEEKVKINQPLLGGVNNQDINSFSFKNSYNKNIYVETCSEEIGVALESIAAEPDIYSDADSIGMSMTPESDTDTSKSITIVETPSLKDSELQERITSMSEIQTMLTKNRTFSDKCPQVEDINETSSKEPVLGQSSANMEANTLPKVQTDFSSFVYMENLTPKNNSIKTFIQTDDLNDAINEEKHRETAGNSQRQKVSFGEDVSKPDESTTYYNFVTKQRTSSTSNFNIPTYQNDASSSDLPNGSRLFLPEPPCDNKVSSPIPSYQIKVNIPDHCHCSSTYSPDLVYKSRSSSDDPPYQSLSLDSPPYPSKTPLDHSLYQTTHSFDPSFQKKPSSLDSNNDNTTCSPDPSYQITELSPDSFFQSKSFSDPIQQNMTFCDSSLYKSNCSSVDQHYQNTVLSACLPHQNTTYCVTCFNPHYQSTAFTSNPANGKSFSSGASYQSTNVFPNLPYQSTTSLAPTYQKIPTSDNTPHQCTTSSNDMPDLTMTSPDDPSHQSSTSSIELSQKSITSYSDDPTHQSTTSSNEPLNQNTNSTDDPPHHSTTCSEELSHQNETSSYDPLHQSTNSTSNSAYQSTTSSNDPLQRCTFSSDVSLHQSTTSSDNPPHNTTIFSDDSVCQSTASTHYTDYESTVSSPGSVNYCTKLSPDQSTTSSDPTYQNMTCSDDLHYQSKTFSDDPPPWSTTSYDKTLYQNTTYSDDPPQRKTSSSRQQSKTITLDDPLQLSKTYSNDPPQQSTSSSDVPLHQSTTYSDDPSHQSTISSDDPSYQSTISSNDPLHHCTTSDDKTLNHSTNSFDELSHQSTTLSDNPPYKNTTSSYDPPDRKTTLSSNSLHQSTASSDFPPYKRRTSSDEPPHHKTMISDKALFQIISPSYYSHNHNTDFSPDPAVDGTILSPVESYQNATSSNPIYQNMTSSDDPPHQGTFFSDNSPHQITSSCGDSQYQGTTSGNPLYQTDHPPPQGTTFTGNSPFQSTVPSLYPHYESTDSSPNSVNDSTNFSSIDPSFQDITSSHQIYQKMTSSDDLLYQDTSGSDDLLQQSIIPFQDSIDHTTTSFLKLPYQSTASFPNAENDIINSFSDQSNQRSDFSPHSIYQSIASSDSPPQSMTTIADSSCQNKTSLSDAPYQSTNSKEILCNHLSNATSSDQSNNKGNISHSSTGPGIQCTSSFSDSMDNCILTFSVQSSVCHYQTPHSPNPSDHPPILKPIQDEFGSLVKKKDQTFLEELRRIFLDCQGQGLTILDSGIVLTKHVTMEENNISLVTLMDGNELGMLAPPSKLFLYYELGKHFKITKQLTENWYYVQDRITKVTMLMKKVPVTSNWTKLLHNFLLLPEHPRRLTPYAAITNRNGSVLFLMEDKYLQSTRSLGMLPLRYEVNIPERILEIVFFLKYCKYYNVLPRNIEDSILYTPQGIWFDPSCLDNNDDLYELRKCLKTSLSLLLCRGQQVFDPCLEALLSMAYHLLEEDQTTHLANYLFFSHQGPVPFSLPSHPDMD
ncbi:uncharacterized protein [Pyxicephalus adspersus]|uniref:uncharacterized protein isoform X2 n=1 Tax=Pyxicephalus adspersus TaxID=30357 RepID=UPI003B5AF81E